MNNTANIESYIKGSKKNRADKRKNRWGIIIAVILISPILMLATVDVSAAYSQAPKGVTNLVNNSYADDHINWTWTDPYSNYRSFKVSIYLNGQYTEDVPMGIQHYDATNLDPNSKYTISVQTVNRRGVSPTVRDTEWTSTPNVTPTDTPISISLDKFGISQIYSTTSNGREWYSTWDNGRARTFGNAVDPYDPEFDTSNGDGTYNIDGSGILKISGSAPRLYIIDPNQIKMWHNVEITVYGMRVSDSNIAWAGIMAYARTKHDPDTDLCDTRGIGGRFLYPGQINFEKETSHPDSDCCQAEYTYWPNGMPKNVWIGYKYVVYDLSDGNVKVELYMDTTDGLNGGTWIKVNEFTDTGSNFGVGSTACKPGIDPTLRLTNSDNRPGSESGKPNLAVYFRSDGVGTDGLWYKKASIREITPP
jgi:hypothetical protein